MHIGDILISLVGVSFAKQCPPKKRSQRRRQPSQFCHFRLKGHGTEVTDSQEPPRPFRFWQKGERLWNYGKALIRKYYLKSDATNSKSFVSFNCSSSKVAFIEVSSLAECKALLARLQIEHMREDRQARLICAMINSHLHSLSCCFGFQKEHLCLPSNYTYSVLTEYHVYTMLENIHI